MRVFLAHGALGVWDEVIFLGITAVFALIMAYSWLRSRRLMDEEDEEAVPGNGDHYGLDEE
ncbi:MAG: hypothetical protein OXF44_03980 [Anaerolineaceae bacterium]|nr:hypothetical protein [Anaerolineaceae bacterium]MCY4024499.1 hypothetical protein [Anaerolineaceae bacterium]